MSQDSGRQLLRLDSLAPEHEALILMYCRKWWQFALSCKSLDRKEATAAIRAAYALAELPEPAIHFCASPHAATQTAIFRSSISPQAGLLWQRLSWALGDALGQQLRRRFSRGPRHHLEEVLKKHLANCLWRSLENQLVAALEEQVQSLSINSISPTGWAALCCYFDFCFSVLECPHHRATWAAFRQVVQHCGWVFPYRRVCLVSERPVQLHFDAHERLHAEGKPAVQFGDGWSLYSWHGFTLPDAYGRIPPCDWQPHWLLEEDDLRLRQVLLEGIGYERIYGRLPSETIDSWGDYHLVRLDNIDSDAIHLLATSRSDPNLPQVRRVPPDFHTAQAAARWVDRPSRPG
ncbi:DUF6745 domain-containing protein [Gloeobacter kilaueensis]|uniref:DUF6745 domain-containing protein n=1 Tax=Gloeobacter kilaueensis (strain ATCC BAA-2537 / CCAP 1431/1 / ULC 316 / JS1) TaxID=1183438 RepID=U5QEN3_GLOK1|nr:hypothetical protein [Gloeobacter kilaueensis]AGY57412.1 hypothetical protein GKIL_1166 [Gloeobacter kilaueensis JS1]